MTDSKRPNREERKEREDYLDGFLSDLRVLGGSKGPGAFVSQWLRKDFDYVGTYR